MGLIRPAQDPLRVAQSEDHPAFRLAWRHCESPVERTARGDHAQVRVEHEKGLAYGVDNGLGQVMPMRDGGERIAFGHAEESTLFVRSVRSLANPVAKPNLGAH
jgi:hypothetical protein